MITERQGLQEWAVRARAQKPERTALDLEADSLHRYRERLCLIQYADESGTEIIDPLASDDMQPFIDWLVGARVWMHGADYDISLLRRTFGKLPAMVLDTQVAARLLGYEQFGLAALIGHFFGIQLSKGNQKADWGKRPIPEAMQVYALGDVKYMLKLADCLVSELRTLDRYNWFAESCEYYIEQARQRENTHTAEPWRIRGSGTLTRRGLAALRALWYWRDNEAREADKPAFMVCSNEELLRRSVVLQGFGEPPPPRGNRKRITRYKAAVRHFRLLDEYEYPLKRIPGVRKQVDAGYEHRLEHWLNKRDSIALQLGIDACLIASRAQAESIAGDEAAGLGALMHWQRELLLS